MPLKEALCWFNRECRSNDEDDDNVEVDRGKTTKLDVPARVKCARDGKSDVHADSLQSSNLYTRVEEVAVKVDHSETDSSFTGRRVRWLSKRV